MASSDIRTGFWVDWTQGNAVTGATVTLSSRGGGFLLAFVVLFVIFVGSQVWFILRFIAHQSSCTDEPQDALHFERQALYRNSSSPLGSVWAFIKLHRAAGKAENRGRTLPPVLLAASCSLSFVLLALFSSAIVGWATENRLLSPKNCGYWSTSNPEAQLKRDARENLAAVSYARECYGESRSSPPTSPTCGFLPVPNLRWKASAQPVCPFPADAKTGGSVCLPDHAGIELRTDGVVDSNQDLGINESPADRVTYSRHLSCHVLRTDGFMSSSSSSINNHDGPSRSRPNDTIFYNYGGVRGLSVGSGSRTETYAHNLTVSAHLKTFSTALYVSSSSYAARGISEEWTPIPQLRVRSSGSDSFPDKLLLLVSQNGILHKFPSSDPLFRATVPIMRYPGSPAETVYYAADSPVVPVAYVEQHQLCFPKQKICTLSVGGSNLTRAIRHISGEKSVSAAGLTKVQEATASRIQRAASESGMADLLTPSRLAAGGGSWLRASERLGLVAEGEIHGGIPAGQFETEIRSVFLAGLAKFQWLALQPVTGEYGGWDGWEGADWEFTRWGGARGRGETCNSQRVGGVTGAGTNMNNTMNFSSLGLGLVFGVGGALVLLRIWVVRSRPFLSGKNKTNENGITSRDQWDRDGVLEIQRVLLETSCVVETKTVVGGERYRYPAVLKKSQVERTDGAFSQGMMREG